MTKNERADLSVPVFEAKGVPFAVVPVNLLVELAALAHEALSGERTIKMEPYLVDAEGKRVDPKVFANTLVKAAERVMRNYPALEATSGIIAPPFVPEDHPEAEEEAADRATYLEAKARDEEALPHAVVKPLVAGEHPVKVFREHRGLTQAELAERAGSRAAYISQIETGKREGSKAMLRKLAKALDVELADLLE